MSASPQPPGRSVWEIAALWAWVVLALGISLRFVFGQDPAHNNVYLKVFAPAAQSFLAGRELYLSGDLPAGGFRYPPVCCTLLLPFAACGPVLGSILWRLCNFAVLLLSVRAADRAGFPFAMTSRERALFLVLLMVATTTSLNNGQANAMILGLLLLATTGVLAGRCAGPGAWISGSTALKVYPLAYGLVLAVLRPRLIPWLLLFVAVAGLLPFALQSPGYVLDQYRALYETLRKEDRTGDLVNAYRDLRLLTDSAGLPMSELVFWSLQLLCGFGIVLVCGLLRRGGASLARVLDYALSLTMCWFMLLGPATEKATYALLGPTLAWPLLAAWRERHRCQLLAFGVANLMVPLSETVAPNDKMIREGQQWLRCFLPFAALVATLALLLRAAGDLRALRARGRNGVQSDRDDGGLTA